MRGRTRSNRCSRWRGTAVAIGLPGFLLLAQCGGDSRESLTSELDDIMQEFDSLAESAPSPAAAGAAQGGAGGAFVIRQARAEELSAAGLRTGGLMVEGGGAGLEAGDLIGFAGEEVVADLESFERMLRRSGDGPVSMLVYRAGLPRRCEVGAPALRRALHRRSPAPATGAAHPPSQQRGEPQRSHPPATGDEVGALVARLGRPEAEERAQAALEIAGFGTAGAPAIPALLAGLRPAHRSVPLPAAHAIGGAGGLPPAAAWGPSRSPGGVGSDRRRRASAGVARPGAAAVIRALLTTMSIGPRAASASSKAA